VKRTSLRERPKTPRAGKAPDAAARGAKSGVAAVDGKGSGRRERQKKLRASQMLDAASTLFAGQGYLATGIEDIAQLADVAPATVYNYFDTKPNLLMALALRHVHAAMPERRAFLRGLPEAPFDGIRAFERLLAEQALRHLSKECWRVILSAPYVDPGGRASRTGARLNNLIKQHYVRMLKTYQERGRICASVDPSALSDLIVGITTMDFGRFVSGSGETIEDLLAMGLPHIRLILAGLTPDLPRGKK
jgi:AcrR family transcriptional regulator